MGGRLLVEMDRIDAIRRRMKLPLPLRGLERYVYAAVMLLLACGVVQSVQFNDWQYFERSGSLVIVIAIMLAWRDLVSLLGDVRRFYSDEFARRMSDMDRSRPNGLISGAMHDGERERIVAVSSEVDELIKMLRARLHTTEAAILILGTVVWGYGSVIARFLWDLT